MKKLLDKIKSFIKSLFEDIADELDRIEAEAKSSPSTMAGDNPAPSPVDDTPEPASEPTVEDSADEVPFGDLSFCWGGFDGRKAALTDAVIGSLKVSSSGLSYGWLRGGCETLGASSREDYNHTLACLFVFDGSKWRGGKFDWISTSRTTRDLKNVESGYNGWDCAAFKSAKAYAFCIVSADGKRRTNVIVQR